MTRSRGTRIAIRPYLSALLLVIWVSPVLVGHAVQAQEFPKLTAPKTETTGIPMQTPGVAALPRNVPLQNLRFKDVFEVDAAKGQQAELSYTLAEPAFVKIRVLRHGTRELWLASIVDFEYREAGTHTEVWDGRDYRGRPVSYAAQPYLILTQGESVPEPGLTPGAAGVPRPVDYSVGESQEAVVTRTGYPGRHLHAFHDEDVENVPLVKIASPTVGQTLRGTVLVTAAVDEKRRGYGDRYGYGVRYYVDDKIIHEEFYKPESGGRFSYALDTTAFDDGPHLIYVGMCDHNDHVTSEGFEIVIANAKR